MAIEPIRPLLCRAIFHSHAAASRLKGRTWAGNAEKEQNSPFIMINTVHGYNCMVIMGQF